MSKTDVDAEFKIRVLRNARALAAAGADDLAELARFARMTALPAGREFARVEQDGAQVFIMHTGVAAELLVEPDEDNEIAVGLAGPGDIAGLVGALAARRGRNGDAPAADRAGRRIEALSNAQALALATPDFLRVCRRNADVMVDLAADLAARHRALADVYAKVAQQSLEMRLAAFFAEIARLTANDDWNPVVNIGRLSQSAIGSMLGVSREHVNRTLAMWERSGLIFQDKRGEIVILDVRRIERLAEMKSERGAAERPDDWLWEIDLHLDRGLNQAALHLALEAARRAPKDLRYIHRAVLATARMGALSEALALVEKHKLGRDLADEELACLKPRLLRDLAFATSDEAPDARLLAKSAADYEKVFDKTGGFYPGVNAAAGYALAGEPERGREIALRVRKALQANAAGAEAEDEDAPAGDYWRRTTLAECRLLEGDKAAAANLFQAASSAPDATPGKKATTRRQLLRLGPHVGVDRAWIDRAAPQDAVAYFCGPIARAATPEEDMPFGAMLQSLEQFLSARRIGTAYGALASGADIVIAERLIERGIEIHVYLPLPPLEFLKSSVLIGGPVWRERFGRCMRAAAAVNWNRRTTRPSNAAYRLGAEIAMGKAARRARQLVTEAVGFFAVPEGRNASTSLSVANAELWRARGHQTAIAAHVWPGPPPGEVEKNASEGDLYAALVLFEDGARLPRGLADAGDFRMLPPGLGVDVRLFHEVDDALAAAERLAAAGGGGWSAWLDAGVFTRAMIESGDDAAASQLIAAACRPQTEPGRVYATEPFASLAEIRSARKARFEYIGFTPAREKIDPCAMYLVNI